MAITLKGLNNENTFLFNNGFRLIDWQDVTQITQPRGRDGVRLTTFWRAQGYPIAHNLSPFSPFSFTFSLGPLLPSHVTNPFSNDKNDFLIICLLFAQKLGHHALSQSQVFAPKSDLSH